MHAQSFLDSINRSYYLEGRTLYTREKEDVAAQLALPLVNRKALAFAKPIDCVIWGPCGGELIDVSEAFPMGQTTDDAGRPCSWLHEVTRGKKLVLILAECCNGYAHEYEELLRRALPDCELLFSDSFPDLCKNGMRESAVLALLHDAILIPAP